MIEVTSRSEDGRRIIGKMRVNGRNYNTICECKPITPVNSPLGNEKGPKCDPSKLRIQSEKPGKGANFDEVRQLVGNIEELNYVSVPETEFRCLDGRNPKDSVSTPGGDAGEFLLGLMVYEDLLGGGRKLTQENVDAFFMDYLKFMTPQKFYMCTDDHAVNHLEKQMGIEGLNIKAPKLSLIPDLLLKVVDPDNIGDLHFRLMVKYPSKYVIRQELIGLFLNAFYKVLWNKQEPLSNKLELEVLAGDHKETAFVEVRSEEACQKQQLAPRIKSQNKFTSAFVNHIDAASIRRAQIASFFADRVNHHQDPVDPVRMHDRLNHHGLASLEITGRYIAKGLPFYTINLA